MKANSTEKDGLKQEDYQPVPGFFELRNFKLSKREFMSAWRIQLFLKRYEDSKAYQKQFNSRQWEEAKVVSAELQMFLFLRLKPGCDLN